MKYRHRIYPLLLAASLTACGGGSGDLVADGGISGSGISVGAITGFGSVILNDSTLDTTPSTSITVGGEPATQDDLAVGQVVRVVADFDAQRADEIEYEETVRGIVNGVTVTNPDTLQATLTVLGQSVLTSAATNFVNVLGAEQLVGQEVDVSGTRNADNEIVATFVERKSSPVNEYRITGRVEALGAATFAIGGLTVDFSGADLGGLPGGSPEEGQLVRVRGDTAQFNPAPPTLIASGVTTGLSLNAMSDDAVEIEGNITAYRSLGDFELNGQRVDASTASVVDGSEDDIALNARLEIEGVIDDNGVLVAERVIVEDSLFVRIDAQIDMNGVDTVARTLTLLGVTVSVTEATRYDDNSAANADPLTLELLSPGDWVEMRGLLVGEDVVAARIERDDPDPGPRVILMAPVEAEDANAGTLTLLGITVNGRTSSGTQFRDGDEMSITQEQFYSLVSEDSLVKARWDPFISLNEPAEEMSIEEED
ncbi:MAG: DUF5666 domain-containing protein [Gammaproteobacteria bacterium]|nr:DUF5666 domain-containing protein [Gammaproteobacteria bacterium]